MDLNYFIVFLFTNKILESRLAITNTNISFLKRRLEIISPNSKNSINIIKSNLLDKLLKSIEESYKKKKIRREIVSEPTEVSQSSVIDISEARQYCGDILYYTLEYYCAQLNGTDYIKDYQNDRKNKRSIHADRILNDNQTGINNKNTLFLQSS